MKKAKANVVNSALTIAVDMHFEVAIPVEDKDYWERATEAERREYLEDRVDCSYCDVGVTLVGKSVEGDFEAT